jgi:glyoxylase-like metal-dependent hydrolase (beta-lactamase superfamily II)
MRPDIKAFFDMATNTVSYVVCDPATKCCAIIDPVLDYDPVLSRTRTTSAELIIDHVRQEGLSCEWILETHIHADHLSGAAHIQEVLGGKIGIGARVVVVQQTFSKIFDDDAALDCDGSQFDCLFEAGDSFQIGGLEVRALHTPGHTPACMTYVIGGAAFVGDTLFMPDYGTARTDFPGGDARALYRSIHKIFALPDETRLFMCHDYLPDGRTEHRWETTVGEEKRSNVHIHDGVSEDQFAALRRSRDARLDPPRLILASLQVNMRAGRLPPAGRNGIHYLKLPVNRF